MSSTTWRPDETREIAELIKDVDICMFVTRSKGLLRGRPMSNNGKVEFDGDNWFFSYRDSGKVADIEADPTVELAYIATDQGTWVSLEGQAEIVEDEARKRELWDEGLEVWFRAARTTSGSSCSRFVRSASTAGRTARKSSWNQAPE
jgi:general stress protein 26